MSPHDLLKYVKDQYDRLAEVSPLLPQPVIKLFQQRFADETEISKPEEANGLEKIVVFRGDDMEIPSPALRQRSGASTNHHMFANPMLKAVKSVATGLRRQPSLKTVLEAQPEPVPAAALIQTPAEEKVEVPSAPIPSS
jgi:hypothetical protein